MHWGEFHSRFQFRSIGHLDEAGERLSYQEKEVFFPPKGEEISYMRSISKHIRLKKIREDSKVVRQCWAH